MKKKSEIAKDFLRISRRYEKPTTDADKIKEAYIKKKGLNLPEAARRTAFKNYFRIEDKKLPEKKNIR